MSAMRKLSQLARLMIATFTFVCALLMTAALDALRASDWMLVTGAVMLAASIISVIAALHLWAQAGDAGETEPEHRGDDGGGGALRQWPDAPQPGGGGSEPTWWPEFERRLAFYVAERERQNRRTAGLPCEPAGPATRP
jgi:hypothetical protein